ncbi:hypothetical protein GYMLUDRAFT_287270 [Collybiopsis luxurians FD-317 M1]|nr:hypothetical protein GYMLUDRAFT_287270 [Collybiopsis luxurians FD-317 M1]
MASAPPGPAGNGRGAPTQGQLRAQAIAARAGLLQRTQRPPPPPGYRHVSVEQYVRAMIARDPWVPHPLTEEEIIDHRRECAVLLATYRRLESRKESRGKEEQEGEVIKAYIAYQLKYWRTFRLLDLPMEIVSNIIRFVVWSAPSPPIGISWRLQLTWVSKYLRHAATSDSTLWNAIWFRDKPPFERSLAFVERSGVSPLDLRINDTDDRRFTDQEICALLEALTPHLHHIRMLIILLDGWEPILSVLKWLSDYGKHNDPPLTMERFEIHRTGNPYIWPGHIWKGQKYSPANHDVTLFSLFGGTFVPTLKSFTMNGVHIDWVNTPSLNDLNTLDIRRIPLDLCPPVTRFREILVSSPNLTKLSLDGAGPSDNPIAISTYPAIHLPHLHTLVLANFAAPFTTSIVSHFTAPHVRDLTIMNFKGEYYGPFYEYMTGRFREIRLLTLYTTNCPPSVLPRMIKWLDSMPLLAYARLAALEYDLLQAFLFDPDTMKPYPAIQARHDLRKEMEIVEKLELDTSTAATADPDDKDREHRVVNPRLTILEVQSIRPEVFTKFVDARKICGVPVRKTYMASQMVETFTNEMINYVHDNIPHLMVVDIGSKTQEEEELMNEP